MSSLKQLSGIDKRTKFAVYGWIREAEKQLKLNYITASISAICILYYRDDAIFGDVADNVGISQNNKRITKIMLDKTRRYGWNNTSYGIVKIPSMCKCIYKWKIKMYDVTGMKIGITSSSNKPNNDLMEVDGNHYMIAATVQMTFDTEDTRLFNFDYGLPKFGGDDLISIILDLKDKNGKLYVAKDNGDPYVVYKKINRSEEVTYRLVVSLWTHNNSVEIMSVSKEC